MDGKNKEKKAENPLEKKMKKQLANLLLNKRIDNNLTQAQTAERTGLTVDQYGRIERGKCDPFFSNAIQLLYAVGATPDDIAALTAVIYELLEQEKH